MQCIPPRNGAIHSTNNYVMYSTNNGAMHSTDKYTMLHQQWHTVFHHQIYNVSPTMLQYNTTNNYTIFLNAGCETSSRKDWDHGNMDLGKELEQQIW